MSKTIYSPQPWQTSAGERSIFLAGSIDMGRAEDWQKTLGDLLPHENLVLLNPRRKDWDISWEQRIENPVFKAQVKWELDGLERADLIVFYFAADSKSPITLLELGLFAHSGRAVVCCPAEFWRKGNVDIVCQKYKIPQVDTLEALAQYVLDTNI